MTEIQLSVQTHELTFVVDLKVRGFRFLNDLFFKSLAVPRRRILVSHVIDYNANTLDALHY